MMDIDVDKELAKLLTRAVARERAAWKREVKKLRKELQESDWLNCTDTAVAVDIGYNKALDDLLQRRAQKGGRP